MIDDDGTSVSAGEKQLLTIARAFLAEPTILILDEATSSVDTRTEVLIQQAMAALRKERTSFVIAHRLSTIRDADIILVMEHGRIVEQGNHEELLAGRQGRTPASTTQFSGAAAEIELSARAPLRGTPARSLQQRLPNRAIGIAWVSTSALAYSLFAIFSKTPARLVGADRRARVALPDRRAGRLGASCSCASGPGGPSPRDADRPDVRSPDSRSG